MAMVVSLQHTLVEHTSPYVRISVSDGAQGELGHVYLFLIINDIHDRPYGLVENLCVREDARGQGVGSELLRLVIALAKEKGCYKLLAMSREGRIELHEWYMRKGFTRFGYEFRLDF